MVTVKIVLPSLQLLCLVCVPSNSLVLVGPDSKAAEEPGVDGGAHQPGEVAADRPRERAKVVEETHVHAHLGQQGKVAEHSPQSPGHTHREHAEAAARHSVPPYTNPHRKPARTAVEHHAHTDKHSQLKRTPKTAERSTPSAAHPHRHAEHSAPSHVPGAPAAGLSTPSPEQQAISADAEPAFPGSSAPHTGLHSLSGSAPTSSQYQMAEYQCASEYATPEYGCKTCNMNRTCSCDGIVKFGYGTDWTNWTDPAQGTIECSSASFGADPKPGRGKVCVCRPRVYMCATEWSRPWANCTQCGEYKTTCDCVGQARFGYGSTWSTWKNVSGTVSCSTSEFGDPVPGQGKVCQCQPLNLYADPPGLTAYEPGHFGGVLKSILAVTLMYFIVYIVLACIRTHNQLKNLEVPSPREKILESAATSCMYFAPMLCVVFFSVSKRADTLTGGSPYRYSMPPDWLQYAVGLCATTFVLQTLCYVIAETSALQGAVTLVNEDNQQILVQTSSQVRTINCWRKLCNVFLLTMYASLAVVMLGVLFMEEPEALLAEQGKTPMRAGTVCTLNLAVAYFSVYLFLHMFRNQRADSGEFPPFGFEVMKLAATAMNFAPMLCIMYMGAQIGADWSDSWLPLRTSRWMYVGMVCVVIQVVLVIAAPYLANAELQVVGQRGEVDFVTRNHEVFICISTIRWVAMFVLYVAIEMVVMSSWDAGVTPGLTHQVFRFSLTYFLAYLFLWVAITMRQLSEGGYVRAIRVLSIAKDTVVFCPMLCALYMSAFVRAHSFTNRYGKPGVPQNWVQDWMVISNVALCMMLIFVTLAAFCSAPDGKRSPSAGFLFGYHVAMAVLFSSVVVVVYGIFTINASTAEVEGAWYA